MGSSHKLESKRKLPSWVYIVLAIVVIFIYQKYQNRPVPSLIGRTREAHAFYAGPNVKEYEEIGLLPAGSEIEITGRNGDLWLTFSYAGVRGWIQEFFLDIDGNHLRLPEVEVQHLPNSTTYKENIVRSYFQAIMDDKKYDSEIFQIHKYLDNIDISISNNELTFTLRETPESQVGFFSLAIDLIFGSTLLSDAGGDSDWNLSKIEVVPPYTSEDYGSYFISGHSNIVLVSEDSSKIYDVMEIRFSKNSIPLEDTNSSYSRAFLESNQFVDSGCPYGCDYHKQGCDIKGNISFDSGEKIYHMPNQEYYSETKINTDYGERWFCTEAEALSNGWRKSYK